MVVIHWTEQSLEDIDNIAAYISLQSHRFASIQVNRFFDKVEILKTQPATGRVVPEFKDKRVREIIIGNYRIIYRIVSLKNIDILTIHHSAMKLSKK